MAGRVVQYPWITNVLQRLLDVRGGALPGGFANDVQAAFDVSRRDPELLLELGFRPWVCQSESPAVAGRVSFLDISVGAGVIVVLNIMPEEFGVLTGAHWTNEPVVGGALPIFSSDWRLGPDSQQFGFTVSFDDVAVVPVGNPLARLNGQSAFSFPVFVLGGPTTGLNHLQLFNETAVNQRLRVSLSGYVLRVNR